jgi:hypothetical protein
MVELLILACLAANPAKCETFNVPFAEPMSLVHCMYAGQLQALNWAEQHPGWTIRRWNCGMPRA